MPIGTALRTHDKVAFNEERAQIIEMVSLRRNHVYSLLTQCKKDLEFAIRKKPLVYIGLMQHFLLVKLGATLPIGQIGREKEKIIITRRHYHCEV
jgi:hypothetical protein